MTVVDRLGRKQPQRLGWGTLLQASPGLAAQFKKVPDSFFTVNGNHVWITCPCGVEVKVVAEDSGDCVCGRIYLYSAGVWAGRSRP